MICYGNSRGTGVEGGGDLDVESMVWALIQDYDLLAFGCGMLFRVVGRVKLAGSTSRTEMTLITLILLIFIVKYTESIKGRHDCRPDVFFGVLVGGYCLSNNQQLSRLGA